MVKPRNDQPQQPREAPALQLHRKPQFHCFHWKLQWLNPLQSPPRCLRAASEESNWGCTTHPENSCFYVFPSAKTDLFSQEKKKKKALFTIFLEVQGVGRAALIPDAKKFSEYFFLRQHRLPSKITLVNISKVHFWMKGRRERREIREREPLPVCEPL